MNEIPIPIFLKNTQARLHPPLLWEESRHEALLVPFKSKLLVVKWELPLNTSTHIYAHFSCGQMLKLVLVLKSKFIAMFQNVSTFFWSRALLLGFVGGWTHALVAQIACQASIFDAWTRRRIVVVEHGHTTFEAVTATFYGTQVLGGLTLNKK